MTRFLLFTCLGIAFISSAAEIKLGIIPLDRRTETVADLTGVLLRDVPGISLLERQKLDAIRKEFQLAGNKELKLNKIQDADLICILRSVRTPGASIAMELVAFDLRSGIRLADLELSGETEAVQAKISSAAIRHAVKKRDSIGKSGEKLKIAMLPFLPINLNRELEDAARKTVTLLRRRFAADSTTLFLEREFMLQALNEPNRENHELLKQLYASVITVRTEGRNDDKGGGLLRIAFEKSNGEIIAEKTIPLSAGQSPQQILSQIVPPDSAIDASDKNAESKKLFQQAWFVFAHGGTVNALELAAAGTALDPKKELEFAGMIFQACFNGGYRIPAKERGAFFIRNLSYAVPIAEKRNHFFFWAMRMISEGHFSPRSLEQFSPEEQKSLKDLLERLIRVNHRIREEKIKTASGDFERIKAMGEYLNSMDNLLKKLWDMSLYGKYIIPKLEIYIAETNRLAPEIEQFYAENKGKKREFNLLQQSELGKFYFDINDYPASDQAVMKKLFDLLGQSEFLHIAWRGPFGYFNLATRNSMGCDPEKFAEACNIYNEALVKCFERCRFPDDRRNYLELQGYIGTEYLLKLMKISIRRFGYYSAVRELLAYQEVKNASRETAMRWHEDIYGFWQAFQKDPRTANISESDRDYRNSTLISDMRALEDKFGIEPKIPLEPVFPTPWRKPVIPVKDFKLKSGRPTEPVFDGRFIYFALLRHDSIQMYKLDTENNFALTPGPELKFNRGWYGTNMTGVLTERHYVTWNGPSVYLFPRDGSAPELLDFSAYHNNWSISMAGHGERLFLSCGQWAGLQKPGTVLEFNLRTRETKVIISTLDKNIDWPMKKFQPRPYHVHQLLVDAERKELLMLLHTNSFAYGWSAPPMKVWGYQYETGKWIERSGNLPIYDGSSGRIYLENNQLIVQAENYGAGPVGQDGVWRPWMMVNRQNRHIVDRLPAMPQNGKLDIDYSTPIRFKNVEFGKNKLNTCRGYADGILFEENALFFIREKIRYPFKRGDAYPMLYLGSKYLVTCSGYSESVDNLKIFPLKDREEILKTARGGSAE